MKKSLFVGMLFALLFVSGQAQEIQFLDKLTDKAVSGVQIDFKGKKIMTQFSDAKGMVTLKGLGKRDTLIISHIAYVQQVILSSDIFGKPQTIYLESATLSHPTIDIVGAREKAISSPQKVKVLSLEEIQRSAPANSAALLEGTGQVMVQRSQQGGGSPIIRGFEANRVLLVIDGVRMNNAIYRSGHLQNAITVDNNILENTEIIFGTSSLIYGSDALGGVVHYHSIDPAFSDSSVIKLSTSIKHATAAQENSAHVHMHYMSKKFTSLSSFSYADFGDLKMGTNRMHGDDEWGLVNDFVVTTNGIDEQRVNPDPNIQKNSGYHQYDITQKLKFKLSDKATLKFNGQYSTTSDIPRFDRYNDYRDGVLREAEWYYGPQQRVLLSSSLELMPYKNWSDKATVTAAYQRIDEDRITRRFGSSSRFTREEDVKVYSLNADMVKGYDGEKKLFYGIELTSNDVESSAFIEDIFTSEISPGLTRYPNGGSTLSTVAGYVSYLNPFHEKWQYNLGLRYNIIESESNFNTNDFFELPFDQVSLSNSALTGSAGLKYNHNENLSLRFLTSTGFRAPNVDDYGKVFDRDGFVVVPDDRLTPEYALNGEVGFTKALLDKKLEVDASLFYTHILNAIVQRDYLLNGNDSLSLEGEVSRIQSNQNASEARIYGYAIGLEYEFSDEWALNTFLNYTFGEVIEDEEPLAHIPPFFAKAELSYEKNKINGALYAHYHDVKSKGRMASGRTDNPNEGLNGYFPSWYTINFRTSYDLTKSLTVQLAVENILDAHYKVFASGLSAPGRNFVFVLRANI